MIEYKVVAIEQNIPITITCDVCKKTFDVENDIMEVQEMLHISFIGGYNSVFGDGSNVQCDICQSCLLSMIGKFVRVEDTNTY